MVRPLRELIRETSGVVFLGAGGSLDSGLPLGDQAAAEIIRECFRAAGLMGVLTDLGIPAKANADSGGNANGIPRRRRTVLGA